jgi:hypothetical protein
MKNEMGGECSTYGGRRGVYRVLVGKPEGKRRLGRTRHSGEGSIKMDLQELKWSMVWLKTGTDGGLL